MMRLSFLAPLLALGLYAPAAFGQGSVFDEAEVIFLGETHDNPAHHARQAELVRELQPTALVFEMLTTDQSAQIRPGDVEDEVALAERLDWENTGWPDFSMYYPIFAAAPEAAIFGAELPRAEARAAQDRPLDAIFGPSAGFYALDKPLPPEQQEEREALQAAAHCDALPDDMLPVMVGIQRLRDARLAETALEALAMHGAPVVVITGNGHARTDWGAPALVAMAAPEVKGAALGQGEDGGDPGGSFDVVEQSEGVADREDPCAAFEDSTGN